MISRKGDSPLVEQAKVVRQSQTMMEEIVSALHEYKVADLRIFKGTEDYFIDFVVIGSGTSDRHIEAMADKACQYSKGQHLVVPKHSSNSGGWVAIDFYHTIVHLMSEEKRLYYDIDSFMLEIGNQEIADHQALDTAII